MLSFVLAGVVAAAPAGPPLEYFVGQWTDVNVDTTSLRVDADGTFEFRKWQVPATMEPVGFCVIRGRLESSSTGVVWRASPDFEAAFRRKTAVSKKRDATLAERDEARRELNTWCSPIWGFVSRAAELAEYEFAPWGAAGTPPLFFVEETQFAGLFGPWPHQLVLRKVDTQRVRHSEVRWVVWVETRDGLLGTHGALTVTKEDRFTLHWSDGGVETGRLTPRTAPGPIVMTTETSTRGTGPTRTLKLTTGDVGFHPASRGRPALVQAGSDRLHFVPVP